MEIIISGKDKKLLQELEDMANRLGLQVKRPLVNVKSNKFYQLMEKAAEDGGLFQSIEDLVEWQRKRLKARALPKRGE